MEFIFYYCEDTAKEPIGRVKASNIKEAKKHFAGVKQLPLSKFNTIFRVEKDE